AVPVRVDLTRPVARISRPAAGQTVGAALDVFGTASDDVALASFELAVGAGDPPVSFNTVSLGTATVRDALLGQWTAPSTSGPYTLRLKVRDEAGNESTYDVMVTVGPRELVD